MKIRTMRIQDELLENVIGGSSEWYIEVSTDQTPVWCTEEGLPSKYTGTGKNVPGGNEDIFHPTGS